MADNSLALLTIGIVRDNDDPDQNGRLRVFIPSVDSDNMKTDDLPWAQYVSPFAGVTENNVVGRESEKIEGITAYGWWAIPKIGAHVLVGFLNGDPSTRIVIGNFFHTFRNFSLPGRKNSANGANGSGFPKTEDNKTIQLSKRNLIAAGLTEPWIDRSRGGWQRNVSEDLQNRKTGKEGYNKNSVEPKAKDSQVVSMTSPGGHFLVFDDSETDCRIRIKTTAGHQVILDDSNERIYVSTCMGKTWLELDEDGHIHAFTDQSFSVRAMKDINLTADRNINLHAKKDFNLRADNNVNIEAGNSFNQKSVGGHSNFQSSSGFNVMTSGNLNLSSSSVMNVLSSSGLNIQSGSGLSILSGSKLQIHGGAGTSIDAGAAGASLAATVSALNLDMIIPSHEPWHRPPGATKRNPNWKP